jgi:Rrf2 family protein
MLSLTSKTAIKAVVYLASKYDADTNVGIKEIAENIDASEHTVGKLLQTLVREGIINSIKGPSGGFFMSKDKLKKPIITIVHAIEGKEVFKECGLGLSKCSVTRPCPIHNEYQAGRDKLEKLFHSRKIIDLCVPINKGHAYLVG